jgi:hypothetical protein
VKHLAIFAAVFVIAFAFLVIDTPPADAAGAPCGRLATVTEVPADTTRPSGVYATGGLMRCPIETPLTLTVSLQRFDGTSWITADSKTVSRTFSRYYRYAKDLGLNVAIGANTAIPCVDGTYRSYVEGTGDGGAPVVISNSIAIVCHPTVVPAPTPTDAPPPTPTPTPEPPL